METRALLLQGLQTLQSLRRAGRVPHHRLQLRTRLTTMSHQGILDGLRQVTVEVEQRPESRHCDVRELPLEHGHKFDNGFLCDLLAFIHGAHALA